MEKSPLLLRIGLCILGLHPFPRSQTVAGRCARLWNRCRHSNYAELELAEDSEQGYGMVSFLVVTCIVVLHFVDLAVICVDFMGKQKDTVFVCSYLTYLPHLTMTLLFCLLMRLYLSCVYDKNRDRLAVFSADYLDARSKYRPSKLGLRLAVFMALPAVCIAMKFVVFFKESGSAYCPRDAFVYIRTIGGVAGYAFYGIFCFVIHCLQLSHREEFHFAAVNIISQRAASEIETTKADIRKLCFGFRGFRDFVGRWLVLSVSLAVLGIVFMIPYTMDTLPEIRKHLAREESNLLLWTVFTWCDKILFLAGPLLAVGGLDVRLPWRTFKESVLQAWDQSRPQAGIINADPNKEERATDSKTLDEIISHINLLKDGGSWIKSTLISSVISIYLGTTLDPSQDLDPWIGLACRPPFGNHTEYGYL